MPEVPMRVDLTGRVALVTGASRGIGRATAEALARAGATVCVNYRQQHDRAKETLQSIEASGGHAFVHQADVSDREAVTALIAAVVERAGGLDILVNNAGISREGLFLEMSDEEWTSVLGTNLDGVYHCARLAARQMLGRGELHHGPGHRGRRRYRVRRVGGPMEPDTTKIWTRAEVRVTVGKLIVESLGVDEATVTDDAALVADLGAESLDFLDLSFKC